MKMREAYFGNFASIVGECDFGEIFILPAFNGLDLVVSEPTN